jgi:hypothetical protein
VTVPRATPASTSHRRTKHRALHAKQRNISRAGGTRTACHVWRAPSPTPPPARAPVIALSVELASTPQSRMLQRAPPAMLDRSPTPAPAQARVCVLSAERASTPQHQSWTRASNAIRASISRKRSRRSAMVATTAPPDCDRHVVAPSRATAWTAPLGRTSMSSGAGVSTVQQASTRQPPTQQPANHVKQAGIRTKNVACFANNLKRARSLLSMRCQDVLWLVFVRPGSSAPRHREEAAKSVDTALCNRRKAEPRVDSAQRINIYVLMRLLVRRIE